MKPQRKIAPAVAKYKLGEQPKDVAYWLSQPPEVRWGATEEIRREYHGWQEGKEPRIEKVITILKRTTQGDVILRVIKPKPKIIVDALLASR
ncbi:MAG: hypothetical protein HZB17_08965 [Chloroflexi bacterium]|nr:hypothetical protein [Chloroflexota bacterium]